MLKKDREALVLTASELQNRVAALSSEARYYANLNNFKVAAQSASRMNQVSSEYLTVLQTLAKEQK